MFLSPSAGDPQENYPKKRQESKMPRVRKRAAEFIGTFCHLNPAVTLGLVVGGAEGLSERPRRAGRSGDLRARRS